MRRTRIRYCESNFFSRIYMVSIIDFDFADANSKILSVLILR